jgi:hypothetical protein
LPLLYFSQLCHPPCTLAFWLPIMFMRTFNPLRFTRLICFVYLLAIWTPL